MAKSKISATELDDEVYEFSASKKTKIFLVMFFLFSVGLISRFSLKESLSGVISNAITTNRSCPINFDKVNISFLLPSITIKNTNMNGLCFGQPSKSLKLGDVRLFLYGPSFSPLGIKFKAEVAEKGINANVYIAAGLGSHSIRIEESIVSSSVINKVLGDKFQLLGDVQIDSVFNIEGKNIDTGNVFIKSENLSIPSQNISAFTLPSMPIQNLVLKASLKSKSNTQLLIDIISFEIGSNESPILGQMKGPIKFNPKFAPGSELSLNGKIKFSQSFLDNFSIIGMFLGGKSTDESGFYNLNLSGTVGSPKPKFL